MECEPNAGWRGRYLERQCSVGGAGLRESVTQVRENLKFAESRYRPRRFTYNRRMHPTPVIIDPLAAREFAVEVVRKLREAGFEALWAGGCVRDRLLGDQPKDYDVATSAKPDEIRDLFGRRRTLAIGASFGVITVVGPKPAGQIEVATFRRDATYSDGRHPDSVTFSNAEEDAQRRDFTINGLFFDPLNDKVIDYVGGQEDLRRGIIKAIRDPRERFAEDKLRMLRAVRFTATFAFALDPATLKAMREQAHEIVIVSAERIAAEMRRMLTHKHRARAVELLHYAELLDVILPEAKVLSPESDEVPNTCRGEVWQRTLAILQALDRPSFAVALAVLLRELPTPQPSDDIAELAGQRWRLARDEVTRAAWLIKYEALARQAHQLPWPRVQRVLIQDGASDLLRYLRAVTQVLGDDKNNAVTFCEQKLALPAIELNPVPLLTGDDLRREGWKPGPHFRDVLDAVRDAQLVGEIQSQAEALALAEQVRSK